MITSHLVYESDLMSRVVKVTFGEKTLVTPAYFPAVSSTHLGPGLEGLVRLLLSIHYPRMLVSAYDIHRLTSMGNAELISALQDYASKDALLFLDSGVFESFWKEDSHWTFPLYERVVKQTDHDSYSSFDVLPTPEEGSANFYDKTVSMIIASNSLKTKSQLIPLFHGSNPEQLVSIVGKFVRAHPEMTKTIAVSEKDCGNTIILQARTIAAVRKLLAAVEPSSVLHVLGCGNPTSILLFSYCGADTFDSLDWNQHTVDRRNLTLGDPAHLELQRCECPACVQSHDDPVEKRLLHNLLFYQDFTLRIQKMIKEGSLSAFVSQQIGQDFLAKVGDRPR